MIRIVTLLPLLTAFVLLNASPAALAIEPIRLDFGWPQIVAPEGFTKAARDDTYDAERGWGFVGNQRWGGYKGRFPHNPQVRKPHLDALTCDGLRLQGTFAVDVADGTYHVWCLVGDLGTYSLQPMKDILGYSLAVEDVTVREAQPWSDDRFFDAYYRDIDHNYMRGDDVYERYVSPLLTDHVATVEVTDGQLTVTGSGANICGMMIWPGDRKDAFDEAVAELRDARKAWFYKVVNVNEPAFEGYAAELTPAETSRGYRVWPVHKMREVWPSTEPEPEQAVDQIKVIVAQDQREVATFAVRPMADLDDVSVEVSDLTCDGAPPLTNVSLRVLFHRVYDTGSVHRSHLPAYRTRNLPADHTLQFWITITTARDTVPGVYSGKVTVTPGNRPPTTLDLKVKVLDLKLKPVEQCAQFVMQRSLPGRYTYLLRDKFPDAFHNGMRQVFDHLKSLGLVPQIADIKPTVVDYGKPTQHIELDEGGLADFIALADLYAEHWPDTPLVVSCHRVISWWWIPTKRMPGGRQTSEQSEHTWRAMRQYAQALLDLRAEHPKWPPFIFVVGAEMSNGGRDHVLYSRKCIEAFKSAEGATVVTCPNGPFEARHTAPAVDILAANYVVPMDDPAFEGLPNERTAVWIYQPFHRLAYGYYAWTFGATGGFKEFYCTADQRPYNSFDGKDLWVNCALPSPDGMVSMPKIEEYSWGVTDLRYLHTLEDWIQRAETDGDDEARRAAADARRVIDNIADQVHPDLRYYLNQAGFWDWSVYDIYRMQIAQHIMRIESLLN